MTDDPGKIIAGLQPLLQRVRTDVTWVKRNRTQFLTDEPLTPQLLAKHLNGGPARGVVPMQPGQSVTMVALLDFDSHDGKTPWAEMQAAALRVVDALHQAGGEPVAFRSSGGRGIHLYMLWDEPQDAYSVRQWLAGVLASVNLRNGPTGLCHGEVEIFPKQDEIAPGKFGNQFILPLAGKSMPLDPFELDDVPKEWDIAWPSSRPVPVVQRPVRVAAQAADTAELSVLRSALAAIPNEGEASLSYDQWRDVVFAVHSATEGSEDGLALVEEFSARSGKADLDFLRERVWPYVSERQGGITVRSLFFTARQLGGWHEPIDPGELSPIEAPVGAPEPDPLPAFKRDKAGNILATVDNLVLALRRPDVCGSQLAYDTFRDELMLAPPQRAQWAAFTDADYVRLRLRLERGGFKPIGRELIRDAVCLVAADHQFDSAQLWLNGLRWDGRSRVGRFLADYFGADDTPYAQAVALYLWTALAGRVLAPGSQADMVPVLVGPQGIGKTRGVAAMVPAPEHFVGVNLEVRDADTARMLRGVLVGEIGELRGLHTRDAESIKDFISRTHERWVPKFKEFSQHFPRRVVFIGTTNQDEFLGDETGNRRWLPVRVTYCDPMRVATDHEQLWAEAAALWLAGGIDYQAAQELAPAVHQEHVISDAWEEPVRAWLAESDLDATVAHGDAPFRLDAVLRGALGFDHRNYGRRDELRLGRVLRALGYQKKVTRTKEGLCKAWHKDAENCTQEIAGDATQVKGNKRAAG